MVSRLKLHWYNLLVVLALVLCETIVESQYYVEGDGSIRGDEEVLVVPGGRSNNNAGESLPQRVYLYNSELVQSAQPVVPVSQGGREEEPGKLFAARVGRVRRVDSDEGSSDEDEDEDDIPPPPRHRQKQRTLQKQQGRAPQVKLPPGFDDKIRKRMKMVRGRRGASNSDRPLQGDPDPIDDDDEDGRKPESRLLWPFSIEITKGAKDKGWGGGGPGGYGSYPPQPPPRTGLGLGVGINNNNFGFDVKHDIPPKQYGRIGITKGRFPNKNPHDLRGGHFHASSGYGPQNGWGWDAFIEHEKHRLKYEILKLKAKKKIAVLQNKVELKKLFSMLLQKKIQALEWW